MDHRFEFRIEMEEVAKAMEAIEGLQKFRIELMNKENPNRNPYYALLVHEALKGIMPIIMRLGAGMIEDVEKHEKALKEEKDGSVQNRSGEAG